MRWLWHNRLTLDLCVRITTGRPIPDGWPGPAPSNVLIFQGGPRGAATETRTAPSGSWASTIFASKPPAFTPPACRAAVTWHADPSGTSEVAELRRAGHTVQKGRNEIKNGIAAVQARTRTGTLPIVEGACPNLHVTAENAFAELRGHG